VDGWGCSGKFRVLSHLIVGLVLLGIMIKGDPFDA
jgi:hypothetical protein